MGTNYFFNLHDLADLSQFKLKVDTFGQLYTHYYAESRLYPKPECIGCEKEKKILAAISQNAIEAIAKKIDEFIKSGMISEKDLGELTTHGLDLKAVEYWKKNYQQSTQTCPAGPCDAQGGMNCQQCNQYYPYANSNQTGGGFKCWSCRNGA